MRKVRKLRNPLSNQLDIFALFALCALCAHTFNLLHRSSSSFFSGRFGGGFQSLISTMTLLCDYYDITMLFKALPYRIIILHEEHPSRNLCCCSRKSCLSCLLYYLILHCFNFIEIYIPIDTHLFYLCIYLRFSGWAQRKLAVAIDYGVHRGVQRTKWDL